MNTSASAQRVAVFAPSFPPAFLGGGPARTLSALVRDAPEDSVVYVLAPSLDADGSKLGVTPDGWTDFGKARVFYASTHNFLGLMSAYREVRKTRPDVIYLNSLFNLHFSIIPELLGALNYWGSARILLAPRGELDPGALNIRSRKKRLFIRLMKLIRLNAGLTWHASAPLEATAIRAVWSEKAHVLTRENETSLPHSAASPEVGARRLSAAFVGRIARKKGLLLALQAMEGVRTPLTFWIYGPEEDAAYAKECRDAARRLSDNIEVHFEGAIPPGDVRRALSHHDALIMPTEGENFGHVIAESLSVSCPVLCSPLTPWTDSLRRGGGIVVEAQTPRAWREAIEKVAAEDEDERLVRRQSAGHMYNLWRQAAKGPHVFTLLQRGAAATEMYERDAMSRPSAE